VIPLFILVGEIVHYAGYNFSLYDATYKLVRAFPGGLAMTTIMASAPSRHLRLQHGDGGHDERRRHPAMKEYKYHPMLNAGAVAAARRSASSSRHPSCSWCTVSTRASPSQAVFRQRHPSAILTVAILGTVVWICRMHPDWGPAGPRFAGRSG